MRTAETILGISCERGKQGLPLERVYRLLFNQDLYRKAYGKIYRNAGAMPQGSTPETVDEMSLAKIDATIEALRSERYHWIPTRRIYIEQKHSTKKRPLSMPTWTDKLLQEVIRLILEAYYEPQFSDSSHGFRPNRGGHTALSQIDQEWIGTTWFIEGDIKACFDSLDHTLLIEMLAEQIHDGRFLRLIDGLLKAGYLEEWVYHKTPSGAPQGGIVSPILANIYLTKLDRYIEETLIPAYTQGTRRKKNREYDALLSQVYRLRHTGKTKEAMALRRRAQDLPCGATADPDYRRLKYCRYADDWLLGFTGPREEAEQIKDRLKAFLHEEMGLDLSEEKTLITHARTQTAQFLGYEITTQHADSAQTKRKRCINGKIGLLLPVKAMKEKGQPYWRNGKPIHRAELVNNTVYSIVAQYQAEYRGLVEYYRLANNIHQLSWLRWVMQQSLAKTLATKLKVTVTKVYKQFHATWQVKGRPYKGLQVTVQREGKKPLIAKWGGIPLKRDPSSILNDQLPSFWAGRSELERRLLADTCELCRSSDRVQVHHIRALKDLHQRGQPEKPLWVQIMAARRRKTLVVCWSCHHAIHAGTAVRQVKDTNRVVLESRMQ
jgi:group II intron reverse transcriptase/maturase